MVCAYTQGGLAQAGAVHGGVRGDRTDGQQQAFGLAVSRRMGGAQRYPSLLRWRMMGFAALYPILRAGGLYAGTRPPKNGISAWLSACARFDVNTISAPAVSLSRPGPPEQIGDAPCDRGRGVDPVDRPWREFDEPIQQQRIMRAGQHDGVGTGGVSSAVADEAGREFGRDVLVADVKTAEGAFG